MHIHSTGFISVGFLQRCCLSWYGSLGLTCLFPLPPQPAFSPCLWMDQDLWLPWRWPTPSPYCVRVSAEEFTYWGWTTAKGWNCGKWRHSEAKSPSLDKSKLWLLLSQCDFVFFHVLLRGGWCGADVLCLGSLGRYVSVRSQFKSKSGVEISNVDSNMVLNWN